ncbi:extracellular solute-binding protein [Parasedimentitalea psychrophila]|uniref:Putrescine-binding periplasmic protein n=1 Tax=Parasedimentitalea psychrophila TaxID=2997337 RepID=A0A9Y2KYT7_9RHOB|nr:extracellular solute-binding protein [Parasedimentitalea psychrophila]WIY25028.1 extracellular solute-binding protein [Parasedimentitalea psychrophila]
MRLTKTTASTLFAATILAAPIAAQTEQVWLYNWSGYIAQETIDSFQEEFGIQFSMDTYGEADEAESRLITLGSGYDLVVVPMEIVGRLIEAGAIQEIEMDAIPNVAGVDQQLQELFLKSMPGADGYVLPYLWGTTGIAYDVDAVSERLPNAPIDSWALIFDPKNAEMLADCGITIVDSVEEVVAAALVYLGLNPHSQSDQDIDAAFEVLSAIAPYVRSFDNNQFDDLLGGEICLTVAWSTDALAPLLLEKRDQYQYILPQEGTNLWADVFVIPSDAANVDQANQLMNHILRPDMMALTTLSTLANNSVPSSRVEIDDPDFDLPVLALPQNIHVPLYFIKPRDGLEKRGLDHRWRRLQIGL